MQHIAPRTEQGRQPAPQQRQQQQPQFQERAQSQAQAQLQVQARTLAASVPGPAAPGLGLLGLGQAQAPVAAQGHASSDRSISMLRDMDPSTHYTPAAEVMQTTSNSSPTEPHSSMQMSGHQDTTSGDGSTDGRKGYGKRELSTSKRAAQNRAAQRAFRQRKEGYIKKLEEQVREYGVLSENFKAIQQENYQLRDYIIALQSRLLEAQGEVPPPPGGLDGLQPGTKQGLGPPQGPTQLPGTATLPRLSELGAVQSQQPPQPLQPQGYDTKMTSAQAALQGPSILRSPNAPR